MKGALSAAVPRRAGTAARSNRELFVAVLSCGVQELRALEGEMAELRAAKGEKEGQLRELKQRMAQVDDGIKKAASRWGVCACSARLHPEPHRPLLLQCCGCPPAHDFGPRPASVQGPEPAHAPQVQARRAGAAAQAGAVLMLLGGTGAGALLGACRQLQRKGRPALPRRGISHGPSHACPPPRLDLPLPPALPPAA